MDNPALILNAISGVDVSDNTTRYAVAATRTFEVIYYHFIIFDNNQILCRYRFASVRRDEGTVPRLLEHLVLGHRPFMSITYLLKCWVSKVVKKNRKFCIYQWKIQVGLPIETYPFRPYSPPCDAKARAVLCSVGNVPTLHLPPARDETLDNPHCRRTDEGLMPSPAVPDN